MRDIKSRNIAARLFHQLVQMLSAASTEKSTLLCFCVSRNRLNISVDCILVVVND